jgi:rRNA maturation RNase YbeY
MNQDFQRYFPLEEPISLNTVSVILYAQTELKTHSLLEHFKAVHLHLESVLLEWMNAHDLWSVHGFQFPPNQEPWSLDWLFCDNPTIQAVNLDVRGKNVATDVLSFPTLENACLGDDHAEEDPAFPLESELPDALKKALTQHGGHLGTVMVSVDYAELHRGEEALVDYVLERFVHGTLHVLGLHHATQADYERVLALQADFKERFTPSPFGRGLG